MNARLIVMAREPIAGRVKTRLAATLGADVALDCYRHLLSRTVAVAGALSGALSGVRAELCVADPVAGGECAGLAASHGLETTVQRGDDLGERMAHALRRGLAGGGRAVVIGTDCAVLTAAYLESAFAALNDVPAVLGPAEDGGYVLLGLARELPVFAGPRWGGPAVLSDTRRLLHGAGARWVELPTLWDVDTEADYRRWRALASA